MTAQYLMRTYSSPESLSCIFRSSIAAPATFAHRSKAVAEPNTRKPFSHDAPSWHVQDRRTVLARNGTVLTSPAARDETLCLWLSKMMLVETWHPNQQLCLAVRAACNDVILFVRFGSVKA